MVPSDGDELSVRLPPHRSANVRARKSPRPKPAPAGLVVKNGSPACWRVFDGHADAVVADAEADLAGVRFDPEMDRRVIGDASNAFFTSVRSARVAASSGTCTLGRPGVDRRCTTRSRSRRCEGGQRGLDHPQWRQRLRAVRHRRIGAAAHLVEDLAAALHLDLIRRASSLMSAGTSAAEADKLELARGDGDGAERRGQLVCGAGGERRERRQPLLLRGGASRLGERPLAGLERQPDAGDEARGEQRSGDERHAHPDLVAERRVHAAVPGMRIGQRAERGDEQQRRSRPSRSPRPPTPSSR